jgi:hypothetical protein
MTSRSFLSLVLLLTGCAPPGPPVAPPRLYPRARLAQAESAFAAARRTEDRVEILALRREVDSQPAESTAALRARSDREWKWLTTALEIDSLGLPDSVDRRALAVMQRAVVTRVSANSVAPAKEGGESTDSCSYDPVALLADHGEAALSTRMYHCFGAVTQHLQVGTEQLTRLTVLGRLAEEPDSGRRRELFLALQPAWQAVDGGPVSPYRTLLAHRALAWSAGRRPYQLAAEQAGVAPDTVVVWLESALDAWRRARPDVPVEPWDFYYEAGQAGRFLGSRIPRDSLLVLNQRYYRDLGADPDSLGVRFDILPRAEKGPVAFTTFGRRAGRGIPPESWVFTTYAEGGFDNLEELLHETGHGIHLGGLDTRPAFTDWPDSDIFTEAIADLAALEIYEPAWQSRYLGDSTALTAGLTAKYFGVMMDMAWALFEIRLEQDPGADPNQVWTELTSHYFHVVPHPELSWWAIRGQLVEETGYMLNYALGAIMVADLRDTIRRSHGSFTTGDPTWYAFLRTRIYRFGLERGSGRVVTDFLGRSLSSQALLEDLARIPGR